MEMFWQNFHFIRPLWFLALIPVAVITVLLIWRQQKSGEWTQLINPNLLPFLIDGEQVKQAKTPIYIIALVWTLVVFALAGPVWQKIPVPVEQKSSSLVICWDLSPSMLAEDIKPSRVDRSRLKLIDLLEARKEGQTAMVAFSGEAYTVTPLTDDTKTIVNLLPALTPDTMPSLGSNPEMAFTQAEQLLRDSGVAKGDIVMLVDEVTPDALDNLRPLVEDSPYQLTLWGIGTEAGAPIPLPRGGFAKDGSGNIVVPKLNQDELQSFATKTGSFYVPFVNNDSDLETMLRLIDDPLPETQKSSQVFDQWFEHGQYLCLLFLPFLALFFRKGFIFTLLLAPVFLVHTPKANAMDWEDLWLNQNQQAKKALENGNTEAAGQFDRYDRRGSAFYELGNYQQAAEEFANGTSDVDWFNKGTSQTRAGNYEQAIESFEKALNLNPDFNQAQQNLEIAKKLDELQKQMEQQQNQDNQSSDNQQQNDQNQQGDQQQSEGENQQQSDQQNAQQDQQNAQQQDSQQGQQSQEQDQNAEQSDQNLAEKGEESENSDEQANPYTEAAEEQAKEQEENEQQVAQQPDEEQSEEDGEQKQMMVQAPPQDLEGQTEEQQMLEQMLRKVPDDPSGLLRKKFQYQSNQRKRSVENNLPFTNNQAKNRW